MTWADWLILTCGVAGVVLAQIPKTQRYACFAGLLGQIGWFSAVSFSSQPGIWLTCLVYALAWAYGLWLHWCLPWLEGLYTMPSAGALTTPASPRSRKKPKLQLVPKPDAKGMGLG
jgi:hypothetical protein